MGITNLGLIQIKNRPGQTSAVSGAAYIFVSFSFHMVDKIKDDNKCHFSQ